MAFFIKPNVLINILLKSLVLFLIHGEVPQRFWGDVVLSAYYLINHIRSSILENKISHSILFSRKPLLFLPLNNVLGLHALSQFFFLALI